MPSEPTPGAFESILAMTIHDIKNSLSLLLERLAEERDRDPERAARTSQNRYEIRRINNNLVRLLGLYRMGTDRYTPQFDLNNPIDLLEEVAADYQEMLNHRGITLEIQCDPELSGWYDKQLLYSLLENAVNNASRYTRSTIRLAAEAPGEWLEIRIEDDGGFPGAMLEREPGETRSSAYDAASGSTGLGLYFAQVVTGLHRNGERRGRIELDNASGLGGGRFTILLPGQGPAAFSFDF